MQCSFSSHLCLCFFRFQSVTEKKAYKCMIQKTCHNYFKKTPCRRGHDLIFWLFAVSSENNNCTSPSWNIWGIHHSTRPQQLSLLLLKMSNQRQAETMSLHQFKLNLPRWWQIQSKKPRTNLTNRKCTAGSVSLCLRQSSTSWHAYRRNADERFITEQIP